MDYFQANTGGYTTTPTAGTSNNWIIDGANQVLDVIGRGATIYGDIQDGKTRTEVAKLNAANQPAAISSSPQPNAVSAYVDADLKKIAAIVGGTMIIFAGSLLWFGRKK